MPRGIAIRDNKIFVATTKCIEIIKNDNAIFTLNVSYTPTVIGINSDGSSVAVGSEVRLPKFDYCKVDEIIKILIYYYRILK